MGNVWVKTITGHIIHLPIIGDDFNDPAQPVDVSAIATGSYDRNLLVRLSKWPATGLEFELEFAPNGRSGSCNRCGLCCTHPREDCKHPNSANECGYIWDKEYNVHKCKHLLIDSRIGLGRPGATACALWEDILSLYKGCALWPDRPVDLIDYVKAVCGYSFDKET